MTLTVALIASVISAQVSLTINISDAGNLSSAIKDSGGNASVITDLTVTGNIDARDVAYMRDSMPVLAILDLGATNIKQYTGSDGTLTGLTNYPENEMPERAFCYNTTPTIQGKTSLKSIVLPTNIVSIGAKVFLGCTGLSCNLTIPNSVTSIGELAFFRCSGLTGKLNIPNSVTSIGNYAFYGCSGFTGSLTIPNSVTSIGSWAFIDCTGFKDSLIIPNSVTSIGGGAFSGCTGLDGILSIPGSITSIEDYTFYDCDFRGELTIPGSVTSIENGAFSMCGFSGRLTIPNSVTHIGNDVFWCCYYFTDSLIIPNSVIDIGDYAFYACRGLKGSLTLGNSLTSIGEGAFEDCNGFTGRLIIPDSVTSIGDFAFSGCSGFTGSLTFPNSVTSIGERAFSGCNGFTGSITIPNSVISIGSLAFQNCYNITDIYVNTDNKNYSAKNGVLFDKNKTKLIYYPEGKTANSYTIPDGVNTITNSAFYNCKMLIGMLTIPSSVTSIESYAFCGCSGINKITVKKVIPMSIYSGTFDSINKNTCELIVPFNTKKTYQTENYWKDFINITETFFVVSFNSKGGSVVGDTTLDTSGLIICPKTPIKTGYTFDGWYKEFNCINAWNFETDIVNTNTFLYAKWTESLVIKSNVATSRISLCPNSASDNIEITGIALHQINIYNIFGDVVMQINAGRRDKASVNVAHLAPGIYLVIVNANSNESKVLKLQKR